ncbi:kinase-like domain-containing protein [Lyophyllum atratum]|nr:kinase-like domain-containing protein [Lyophyllum atratum]
MSPFPEEPLDLSTQQGFGYFAGYPGLLLKQGRYKLIRKLGFGPRSSVWLASDLQDEKGHVVALKILTTHATSKKSQELHVLQLIRPYYRLPVLQDHFTEQSHHGKHQCFALNSLGPDLDKFRQTAPTRSLGVHTVQKVVARILEALCDLKRCGVIHGAVRVDNFLFSAVEQAVDIQPILDASPPSVIQEEVIVNGTRYPLVLSEPLAHKHQWDDEFEAIANYGIYLNNVGHARMVSKKAAWDTSLDPCLRPPEVILGTGYDTKVDTWMLGCATYHLLTGKPLFPDGLSDAEHLARMLAIAGDLFSTAMAKKSKRLNEFFDADGYFEHPIPDISLQAELEGTGCVSEEDIPEIVEFIQECLSLDPKDRPTASNLARHAWVRIGYACSCGFIGYGTVTDKVH